MTWARRGKKAATGQRIARIGALAVSACAALASAEPPGTAWQLRWADEFNGGALDPIKWNTNYPWGPTDNHEAYMSPDHVTVGGGLLNLTATRGIPAGAPATIVNGTTTYTLNYTSGAVNTSGKLNFTYGYIEARLQMPATLGAWPAFWTHQHTWPPEIDIQETPFPTYDAMSHYYATYHYGVWQSPLHYGSGSYPVGTDTTAGFHDYAVDWEPDHLTFYFDGRPTFTVTDAAAVSQCANMYLILNLAVGGWPGEPPASAPFPATYQADWVRVWQHAPATAVSTWTHAGDGSWNWDTDSYWDAGAPKLGGQTAVFGNIAAAGVQLNWTGSKTLGGLAFRSDTNYTLGGPGQSLMLTNAAGPAHVDVLSGKGRQSIASRLELYSDATIRNDTAVPFTVFGDVIGPGKLTVEAGPVILAGVNTYSGGTTISAGSLTAVRAGALPNGGNISNSGVLWVAASNSVGTLSGPGDVSVTGGQLDVQSLEQNALSIGSGATVRLHDAMAPSTANSLSILAGGTLDMTKSTIAVSYPPGASPVATIRGYLLSGYAGGAWSGFGIMTSAADSIHTLGYADAVDGLVNVPGNVVVIAYALAGDFNLDGRVDFADLLTLVQHYGQTGMGWDQGDVNYDGGVGFADLLSLAQTYGISSATSQLTGSSGNSLAAVPEPAWNGSALLLAGMLGLRRTKMRCTASARCRRHRLCHDHWHRKERDDGLEQ